MKTDSEDANPDDIKPNDAKKNPKLIILFLEKRSDRLPIIKETMAVTAR
jgi:hypothetical protein